MNKYLKGVVGLLGAVGTALQTQYPGNHWSAAVIAVFTAALVYLVPNEPTAPKVVPPQSGASFTPSQATLPQERIQ